MSAHARDAPDPNDDGWTWPPVPHDLNGLPVVESLDDFEKRVTPLGGFQDAKTALKRPNGVRDRDGGEIVLVNAADIEPEPVSWLWHNGLQISVLNLLAGRPAAASPRSPSRGAPPSPAQANGPTDRSAARQGAPSIGAARTASKTRCCRVSSPLAATGSKCPLSKACVPASTGDRSTLRPICRSSPTRSRNSATCG